MRTSAETLLCLGPSQWPLVQNGSQVQIRRQAGKALRRGSLVVFSKNGIRICHRLLRKKSDPNGTYWLAKGDANLKDDGWICESQVEGMVVSVDGRSVRHPLFAIPSFFFFVHSLLQREAFFLIFQSRVGRRLGRLRMKLFPRPIFMPIYGLLSAPWVFLRKSR